MLKNMLNRLVFAIWGGGGSDLSSKFNKLNRYNFIKESKRGAILIEFAFAVPILFSLIYYVYDLSKMKRYNEQTDFVAHQIAQILQNVSNNQPITKAHIQQAVAASYLSIYAGKTIYSTSGDTGPFYGPGFAHGKIYYVTCANNGKASVKWCKQFQIGGGGTGYGKNPDKIGVTTAPIEDSRASVRGKLDAIPSEIYPSLVMNPGEVKIIVEACIFFSPGDSGYRKVDRGSWSKVPIREEFGLYFISPKPARTSEFYFEKVVIFTPKPGLFSETAPQ